MEPSLALRVGYYASYPRAMAARPSKPAKRDKKLSAPANDDELDEFAAACREAEIEPADTLRKLAHALALHVKRHKSVVFPIRISRDPAGEHDPS